MWWTALIGPISKAFGTWQEKRSQVKNAEHERNLERIRSHTGSWKDEAIVIIWAYPFVSAFIPFLQPNTIKAFEFMTEMPDWYLYSFGAISFAVFGIEKAVKYKR